MARHPLRYRGVVAACVALVYVFFAGASYADETCNSPYISKLIKGQRYFYLVESQRKDWGCWPRRMR